MSRRSPHIPSYRLHKSTGQARVIIDGNHVYLGKYNTQESRERYDRLIAEWLSRGRTQQAPITNGNGAGGTGPTINQLILAYFDFASGYYQKHGKPTGEINNIRDALRPLRRLYGTTQASEFGPDELNAVRKSMEQAGLSRVVINSRVSRIRRMFRWGSTKRRNTRWVSPGVYHELQAVAPLQPGRTTAPEREPVKAVSEAQVRAVLQHVTSHIRAMIECQNLTGMRPQDVRNMRTCDLITTGDVWIFSPWTHKNEHLGHKRNIAIGPKAQAILKPFLKPCAPTEYVFSPRDSVAEVRAKRRAERKTPMTPSQRRRKPKRLPKRAPGEQYAHSSYVHAVHRACEKAGISQWGPNQLRHSCAARVRKLYGLEGAAAVLGHKWGEVTERYAGENFELAVKIMKELG